MHDASACKDHGIGLVGHSCIGQASRRIAIGGRVDLCVHVRDGAGKHILMDLKGDGILILRQNVNARNATVVFGSSIDGNQLNVFRAFIFKDLNVTCLWTLSEVRTCLWTLSEVRIATGHSYSGGAHRGR
jgi:hypothetical protein